MKYTMTTIFRVLLLGILVVGSHSQAEMTADQIMEKVDSTARESFATAFVKTKLSTCSYEIRNERIQCKSKPRVTVLEAAEQRVGEDNKDSKSVALVLEPIADKGIGMLTYAYYDADKDNDVWLYLSALGKVKRLVSSSEGGEDGGSFFGTEFFVDDVSPMKLEEFSFKLLGEEDYQKRAAWMIEATPTAERLKKTHYGKLVLWVDKERFVVMKQNLYNHYGKLFKQRLNENIEQVSGVWIAKSQTMNNFQERRITANQNIAVTYHVSVPEEFLTQRTLTDFSFRERILDGLRSLYKQ